MPVIKRNTASTFAYASGRTVKTTGLMCSRCCRELQAHDIEVINDDSIRAICASCHVDRLTIERQ
jgi:hypothetical protein